MSTFAVEVVRLDDVLVHPNADALELAQIGGYRAVVQKGLHKKGDLVIYVPEAALIPDDVIEAWGFTGKLSGSKKNRVKAIKLRGELSQGLVIPLGVTLEHIGASATQLDRLAEFHPDALSGEAWAVSRDKFSQALGRDLAPVLGIEKWEEPIPVEMAGRQRNRPEWMAPYTDIENIKKYNRVLEEGEEVVFTEKIHGTNFGAGLHADNPGELIISSRRCVLLESEDNLYWRAARQENLHEFLRKALTFTGAKSVVIYGEIYGAGVQDLTYGVPNGHFEVRFFDILLDGKYVGHETFLEMIGTESEFEGEDEAGNVMLRLTSEIPMVPVLYRGPWSEEVCALYTRGNDTLSGSHMREGIVIRPVKERKSGNLGRVILKSISPEYLLRKGGTERQ